MTRRATTSDAPVEHSSILPAARGLNRAEAAGYVGVSPTTFDKLVLDRKMPTPIKIGARRIWDRRRLDLAFDALQPDDGDTPNPWDGEQ